jgi:hypothetical protein
MLAQSLFDIEQLYHNLVNVNASSEGYDSKLMSAAHDIMIDCRKKAVSILRTKYADTVRNLITTSRKRISTKTSLDGEKTLIHSQRYLSTLLELLGTWSNIISDCECMGLSYATLAAIISPLHDRVMEMSVECFNRLKEDKNIQSWIERLQEKNALGETVSDSTPLNIISLDAIIAQVSSMRSLIHQYSVYLTEILSNCFPEISDPTLLWRESDAVYTALEYGYLSFAVKEALQEEGLLEVQEGGTVYVLQSIEDVFFVLQKALGRVISTGSESSILAVCNRIIEILEPTQETMIHDYLLNKAKFKGKYFIKQNFVIEKSVSSKTDNDSKGPVQTTEPENILSPNIDKVRFFFLQISFYFIFYFNMYIIFYEY